MKLTLKQAFDALMEITREMKSTNLSRRAMLAAGSLTALTAAERFEEVSLSDWLAHSPAEMVAETLNLDPGVIEQFPKNRPGIVPA